MTIFPLESFLLTIIKSALPWKVDEHPCLVGVVRFPVPSHTSWGWGKKLLDSDFGTLSLVFPLDSSFLLSAEIPLLQPLLLSLLGPLAFCPCYCEPPPPPQFPSLEDHIQIFSIKFYNLIFFCVCVLAFF